MNLLQIPARLFRPAPPVATKECLTPNLSAYLVCCGIGGAIRDKRPFLVSRLGWFEAYSIGSYEAEGRLSDALREKMWNTPGIFPATEESFVRFRGAYLQAMPLADIFGLMRCPYEKSVITNHAPQALLCELGDLEPYYHPVPWSRYLAGLRVLVIHPFAASIASQYLHARTKLFLNPEVLPEFDLVTIMPPQTLCGNTGGFASWCDALAFLKEKVAAQTFDVAVIGCGAYGLPTGAFIKEELGKVCIHLGGATQMLFGVTGGRWDAMGAFRLLCNESWCRPSVDERPPGWQAAENGCYW